MKRKKRWNKTVTQIEHRVRFLYNSCTIYIDRNELYLYNEI